MMNHDAVKDNFYEELNGLLYSVSINDKLVLLGDFNARIGRRTRHPGKESVEIMEFVIVTAMAYMYFYYKERRSNIRIGGGGARLSVPTIMIPSGSYHGHVS